MPLPWTPDVARSYWTERKVHILDSGPHAADRIRRYSQEKLDRSRKLQADLCEIESRLHLTGSNSPPASTNVVLSLDRWCRTLSWSKCADCGSLMAEKLLPSFTKLQKSASKQVCHCAKDKYIVPLFSDIPFLLRALRRLHVEALRPFHITSGTYQRMKYGYRKKTDIFRLSCPKLPVVQKIAMLSSEHDQTICITALNYLLSNSHSSYRKFYDLGNQFLRDNTDPNIFDVYTWEGIECALWPHLYPFTSWCETIHDGSSDRRSSKISFLAKCLSALLDYSLTFDLLQFHFDRWLYKTITGAIHSSRSTTMKVIPAFHALQDKPFSKGYWEWQHLYLIDAVMQFGLPSLFLTISTSEWSFPTPLWLDDIREQTGYGPTNLPFFETLHFLHVLEQIVRGYLCGSNDARWSQHLFSYNHNKKTTNIRTYFYRFEFQKRGTVHIHFLIWLKNVKYIDYDLIRGDIPSSDPMMLHLVNKCQVANKSSLPLNEHATHIDDTGTVPILKISHPPSAHAIGLRAYIETLLPVLKSSMDVQTTNGKHMLMKYVTSYVAKGKESFHNDQLYTATLSPAVTALKYAMSLDIAEPEKWVLLSSKKLSWTNATRKQYSIPVSPEHAASNAILQKYYTRPRALLSLSLLQWLRSVDDAQAVPLPYPAKKVVLVGLKFCSIFNPAYFFQYLLVHYPHTALDTIIPSADLSPPAQIVYFYKAQFLMPTEFSDGASFASTLDVYGHKQYFLDSVSSFVQSLIDLNNSYRRQLLPESSLGLPSQATPPGALQLHGNQLVFYNYFRRIVEQREDYLLTGIATADTEVDWQRFPLLLGRPGTGKSYTLHHCIDLSIAMGLQACVATPTGTLACTYRDLYGEKLTSNTIHSIFFNNCSATSSTSINPYLSVYDVIFIDEISQVSVDLFHHVVQSLSALPKRPILILCGDFCQQQPLTTRNHRTVETSNILSCGHCMSSVLRFTLVHQYRINDDCLLAFLQHIRSALPTQAMIDALCKDRVLWHSEKVDDTVYSVLRNYPDYIVLTVSRRSASLINRIVVKYAFPGQPLALIVADDECLIPVHRGMKMMLTRNINKSIGFVNGQFVHVHSIAGQTIVGRHPNGHIINIFPLTTPVNDVPVTKYPVLPGYATTISKVQGQTLSRAILWLDTSTAPRGMAYVAMSRVRRLADLYFLQKLTPSQFCPVDIDRQ